MAEIIKSSKELTKEQIYFLTKSKTAVKMAECDGQVVDMEAWALYSDADYKTGEMKEILAILTTEGETLVTVSDTFKRDFLDIVDIFGDEFRRVKVVTGKSNNNRTFVTCEYSR